MRKKNVLKKVYLKIFGLKNLFSKEDE